MNYYEKYIKYKNKYNTLKQKNLVGGEMKSSLYHLHIRFSDELEKKIEHVENKLYDYDLIKDKYFKVNPSGKTLKKSVPAHITLGYGPILTYDTSRYESQYEIKDRSEVENVYPNFLETFKDRIPIIKYIKISPFLRADKIVIKLELESELLTEMLKFLRKIESCKKINEKMKHEYDIAKIEIRARYPKLFTDDQCFDNENPVGALHITLVNLKPDTPEEILIEVIKYTELELSKIGINLGDILIADRIDIKTPITKKFIDIYKY